MKKNNLKKLINSKGFTLVELLVTLSIFAVTTGIVMTSQGKFDNSVLLTNTAYDIAITIRQAQTYGVNVKESLVSNKYNPYGVRFDLSISDGDNKRFNLFEDSLTVNNIHNNIQDGNFICTSSDEECVNSYKLKRGHYIKSICVGTNESDCDTNAINTSRLDISFVRPNPEAVILGVISGIPDTFSSTNPRKFAKIVISSADDTAKRSIVVTKVGQIYVKK